MDEVRRALERRAKDAEDWQARVELARLRVRLGELALVGETRWHFVVSDRSSVRLFPLDPPNTELNVAKTLHALSLMKPLQIVVPVSAAKAQLVGDRSLLKRPAPRFGVGHFNLTRIVPLRSEDPRRD